jgi:hypothetical protein
MMGQTWDRLALNRGLDNTIGEERNSSKTNNRKRRLLRRSSPSSVTSAGQEKAL